MVSSTHPGVESFSFWMVAGDPKNLDRSGVNVIKLFFFVGDDKAK
jgi:hypothetical protein